MTDQPRSFAHGIEHVPSSVLPPDLFVPVAEPKDMPDQPTPTPPRTWWDGEDYRWLYDEPRQKLPRAYALSGDPSSGAVRDEWVELVPAPDLARLRAGWALLEGWFELTNSPYLDTSDLMASVRALLDEGGEE